MKAEFEIREEDPSSGVSTSVKITDVVTIEDKDDIECEMNGKSE